MSLWYLFLLLNTLWNRLPENVKLSGSLITFRCHFKRWLICLAYPNSATVHSSARYNNNIGFYSYILLKTRSMRSTIKIGINKKISKTRTLTICILKLDLI